MSDHYNYRDDGLWLPFLEKDAPLGGVGHQTTLPMDGERPAARQPIGFRGANPGLSLDDRGLPRVRVKAITRRCDFSC